MHPDDPTNVPPAPEAPAAAGEVPRFQSTAQEPSGASKFKAPPAKAPGAPAGPPVPAFVRKPVAAPSAPGPVTAAVGGTTGTVTVGKRSAAPATPPGTVIGGRPRVAVTGVAEDQSAQPPNVNEQAATVAPPPAAAAASPFGWPPPARGRRSAVTAIEQTAAAEEVAAAADAAAAELPPRSTEPRAPSPIGRRFREATAARDAEANASVRTRQPIRRVEERAAEAAAAAAEEPAPASPADVPTRSGSSATKKGKSQ